jgi:hypothetical protein
MSFEFIDRRIQYFIQQHEQRISNMPMVNTSQARVELSAAQLYALMVHIQAKFSELEDLPPMIWIEETNLGPTLAVGGKGMPLTMITHQGDVHEIGEPIK